MIILVEVGNDELKLTYMISRTGKSTVIFFVNINTEHRSTVTSQSLQETTLASIPHFRLRNVLIQITFLFVNVATV